jgi:DNA-binding PadR family transcriptional regulator
MARGQHLSLPAYVVLRTFFERPCDEFYGYKLRDTTGVAGDALYPILTRFTDKGWLCCREVNKEPRASRKYYRLNPDIAVIVRDELTRTEQALGPMLRYLNQMDDLRRANERA